MSPMTKIAIIVPSLLVLGCTAQSSAPEKVETAPEQVTAEAASAETVSAPDITSNQIADGFHVLFGPGGNIGVSSGEDGVFVIDDKFSRFSDQILFRIKEITTEDIKFVINTHYHGDHTGANAEMKDAGATIVAHDNVRARMGMRFENKVFGRMTEPTDPSLWPTLTFSDTATFHFNGQTANVIHIPAAHTDGDSIIQFEEANIIHMGDNYFNGMFPYIDVDGGGSIDGMIQAHSTALELSNADTQIIPGHGPIASAEDLQGARQLLIDVKARVQGAIDAGDDVDTMVTNEILSEFATYDGFINQENMIRIVHRSLSE